jgi:hypothetical protein
MIQPRSLDLTLGEYDEDSRAWAIQARSGRYLTVPDVRFPGRRTVRFFTSEYDASRVLEAVLEIRPELDVHKLVPVQVRLLEALSRVAAEKTPPRADSFTVHSTSEVYDFVKQLRQKAAAPR